MQVILDRIHPTQGREIHVEKIDAIYNWTEWFSAVGLEMSGIASTHLEPEANHCWRWGEDLSPDVFPGTPATGSGDSFRVPLSGGVRSIYHLICFGLRAQAQRHKRIR